jgi:hypothetical protein
MYRMALDITTLPDDPELLKKRIAELASELDSISTLIKKPVYFLYILIILNF